MKSSFPYSTSFARLHEPFSLIRGVLCRASFETAWGILFETEATQRVIKSNLENFQSH